ncbi:nucleoside-diphosphate kinase (plasmid) [Phyllobacterium sp. A18/5-2]|uniref:nucleoside-diphosphate kinase n=1 Tax=Phyllobacterium sp. A18/5-2 TaxID=2978392 RepID=UPI0021C8BF05|nr:nucleoside-diphosphate kinase [Phyllobacterium sp. A18/5-2]UXN66120.1 nucleoside-diphosphate kinase [Phyllobacterium sp. A18/5-2]
MFKSNVCQLTTKDYYTLQSMQDSMFLKDELMRSILRDKLSNAIVTFPEDIPSTVVTLNSRISYRVDGGLLENRVIGNNDMRGIVGLTVISISHPRGLTLLGLAEGQSAVVGRTSDARETVKVEKVFYQPEAEARRVRERRQRIEETERGESNVFRLEDRALSVKGAADVGNDNDDRGPPAA